MEVLSSVVAFVVLGFWEADAPDIVAALEFGVR